MTRLLLVRLFVLCVVLFFLRCEKDDICAEATPSTPLFVLRFYNQQIPDDLKKVKGLRIVGEGKTTALTKYNGVETDSIAIPLKFFDKTTKYKITNDYAKDTKTGVESGNEDTVEITYETAENFLYRGCGFVGNFENVEMTVSPDTDNWIKRIVVEKPKVENDLQAHIRVYH